MLGDIQPSGSNILLMSDNIVSFEWIGLVYNVKAYENFSVLGNQFIPSIFIADFSSNVR